MRVLIDLFAVGPFASLFLVYASFLLVTLVLPLWGIHRVERERGRALDLRRAWGALGAVSLACGVGLVVMLAALGRTGRGELVLSLAAPTRWLLGVEPSALLWLGVVPLVGWIATRARRGAAVGRSAFVAGQGLAAWAVAATTDLCSALAPYVALRHCVAEGARIALADGGELGVEHVRVGTRLLDRDGREVAVRALRSARVESTLVIDGRLRVTESHPLLVGGRWVPAGRVRVGDLLARRGGGVEAVSSVERVVAAVRVYDLSVSGSRSFIADGVVVHNKTLF